MKLVATLLLCAFIALSASFHAPEPHILQNGELKAMREMEGGGKGVIPSTAKTSAQGLQITVGKGATNVSFTVQSFSEFTSDPNAYAYFKFSSIYVDYPGGCYTKETVQGTGSFVVTAKVECVVVGPVMENSTFEVFAQGWTFFNNDNNTRQMVASSDRDTVKLVVK